MYTYGFTQDRVVFHFHGLVTLDQMIEIFKKIFNDPRWQPGKTIVLGTLCDQAFSGMQMQDYKYLADFLSSHKPKALAILIPPQSKIVLQALNDIQSFIKLHGIQAKIFHDLEEMFRWIEK